MTTSLRWRCCQTAVLAAALVFRIAPPAIAMQMSKSHDRQFVDTIVHDVVDRELDRFFVDVAIASDTVKSLALGGSDQEQVPDIVIDRKGRNSNASDEDRRFAHIFSDVSEMVFPREWYAFNHVGYPRRYASTPVFRDINDDGRVDFFYHNHFEQHPETDWDFGISRVNESGNPSVFFEAATSRYFVCTEVQDTLYTRIPSDMHGVVILDIDRDGLLDMYITTGGGMGMDHGPAKNPLLLWGEVAGANESKHLMFRGGRDIVEASNLQNIDSRGRFTYFADLDKDGLLDVVFGNDVRVDADNRYGYAMLNRGDRYFVPHMVLSEYASTMIVHDADGDGHADEFVMQRTHCLPVNGDDGTRAGIPDEEYQRFCDERPRGSTAIYKYLNGSMQLISPAYSVQVDGEGDVAHSMQSGDFDNDAVSDLLVLYDAQVSFFHSSKRQVGSLPVGQPSARISWPPSSCSGRSLRVADFNLDGLQDLLVMCQSPGTHRLYMQAPGGYFWFRNNTGDVGDVDLPKLKAELLPDECSRDSLEWPVYLRQFCTAFQSDGGQEMPSPITYGMSVVDFDNDGYLDVVLTHDVGKLLMLRNTMGELRKRRRFLAVRLNGTESNEYGVGATMLLTARMMGKSNQTLTQLREVYSAMHETEWWGGRDDRHIFGLGMTGVVESLVVRWPGRNQQVQTIIDEELLEAHCNTMTGLLVITEPQPPSGATAELQSDA
eukprot:TRINITY_DN3816_c0_g1_i1.p1 TRINITY_DN3816_c0_g1~~TRINITY_DN3816_c0_g1_i1.p1  ORF type:complete len:731 (-),score=114.02 TRINITY_DN3816_c0_g1_i1:32-2182(-)